MQWQSATGQKIQTNRRQSPLRLMSINKLVLNRHIKWTHLKKSLSQVWTRFYWVRIYCSTRCARVPLVPQRRTIASNTYRISVDKLRHHIYVIMSWNRIENNDVFIFLRVKLRVKQLWKKTCCKLSASKNCRLAQKWIRLVLHGNCCI